MPAPEGINSWTITTNVKADNDIPDASEEVKAELSKVLNEQQTGVWTFEGTHDELRSLIQGVSTITEEPFNFIYDTPLPGQPPQGSHWRESGYVDPQEDGKDFLRSN